MIEIYPGLSRRGPLGYSPVRRQQVQVPHRVTYDKACVSKLVNSVRSCAEMPAKRGSVAGTAVAVYRGEAAGGGGPPDRAVFPVT